MVCLDCAADAKRQSLYGAYPSKTTIDKFVIWRTNISLYEMIYPGGVMPWLSFIAGLAAGGLIAGLWMRAKLARLEAAKQFAESGAAKLTDTFPGAGRCRVAVQSKRVPGRRANHARNHAR